MTSPLPEGRQWVIINAECVETMQTFPDESINVIITDPPYGISYDSCWREGFLAERRFEPIIGDDAVPLTWMKDAYRVTTNPGCIACFCRWDVQEEFRKGLTDAGWVVKSQVIWDRVVHGMGDLDGQFGPQHDVIWFAVKGAYKFPGKRPTSVLRFQRVDPLRLVHPAEKPLPLLRALIGSLTKPGDVVADVFCGSGVTGVAAVEFGRRFIGIDLDASYAALATRRLLGATRQVILE